MRLRRVVSALGFAVGLGLCGNNLRAQDSTLSPQLHVLAVGIDAVGTQVTSFTSTKLGTDTQAFVQSIEDANVTDVHFLLNDANQRNDLHGPDPIDLELDRMQKSVGSQDTVLVVLAARMYVHDNYSFDLDKYGIDIRLAHLLVRLRKLPCANIVLVLPGSDKTVDIGLRHYVESFPEGTGAANIDLVTSSTLQDGGQHTPLLPVLAGALRGNADADHDGVITSTELNQYLNRQASASRPTALERMDPTFRQQTWTVTTDLIGKDFTVLSRIEQARAAGVARQDVPGPQTVRGITAEIPGRLPATLTKLPRTYAVLFATGHYDNWPVLANPINDGRALQAVLRDTYGVETELVPDPTADDVVRTLLRYIAKAYEDNAQLIVFFAGHGYFAEDVGVGYLVTRDSKLPTADPTHRSLLSFDDIRRYVGRIPAKHVLLILDSCFSGTIDQRIADGGTRDEGGDRIYAPRPLAQVISDQAHYQARRFITSGGKEYVPDGYIGEHSPFTKALLQTLQRNAVEHGYTRWRDLQAGLEAVNPMPRWAQLDERDDLNGDIILLTPSMRDTLLSPKP